MMGLPTIIHAITNTSGWVPVAQVGAGGPIGIGGTISSMLLARRNQQIDDVKKFKADSDAATYRQAIPVLERIWKSLSETPQELAKSHSLDALGDFERLVPRIHFFDFVAQDYITRFFELTIEVVMVKYLLGRYTGEDRTHDHSTELRRELDTLTEKFKDLYTQWNRHLNETVGMQAVT